MCFTTYTVQDVAFQLERLVGGMYVYNRQCYTALKQAAVFPIEVQLSIHPPPPLTVEGNGVPENSREGLSESGEGAVESGEGGKEGKLIETGAQEDLLKLIDTD